MSERNIEVGGPKSWRIRDRGAFGAADSRPEVSGCAARGRRANAKCAGIDFTVGLEGVWALLMRRDFSSVEGKLLVYPPKMGR